ncbi:MAG: hypothetical protein KDM63_20555, partial [Verrucomicrobiae bacterium]|nr:hypothetical protein [Verrucomicrobiae bacterium]
QIHPDAVVTSSGGGFFGELRFYVPTPVQNQILDGAFFNNNDYTRTPTPDGTRADELPGTDHEFTVGVFGEPDGQFVPDGAYAPSGFGLYNIYYGATPPVIPPTPGGGGGGTPVVVVPPVIEEPVPVEVVPGFDFSPFVDFDKYDSFDRDENVFLGDFIYGLFSVFGLDRNAEYENAQMDGIYVEGQEILEESPGMFGLGPAQSDAEEEEEENKSGRYLNYRRIPFGQFWTYDVMTGEYSSLRVFGIPSSELAR